MNSSAKDRSNSSSEGIIELSWSEYIDQIDKLLENIKIENNKTDVKIDAVYGIPRGGSIPAVVASHTLKVPCVYNFFSVEILYYNKILVIDDICDTGKSLKEHLYIPDKIVTASIYKHKLSPFTPDYYFAVNSSWIKFPYESEV